MSVFWQKAKEELKKGLNEITTSQSDIKNLLTNNTEDELIEILENNSVSNIQEIKSYRGEVIKSCIMEMLTELDK